MAVLRWRTVFWKIRSPTIEKPRKRVSWTWSRSASVYGRIRIADLSIILVVRVGLCYFVGDGGNGWVDCSVLECVEGMEGEMEMDRRMIAIEECK